MLNFASRNSYGIKASSYRSPKLWNSLQEETLSLPKAVSNTLPKRAWDEMTFR